MPKYQLKNMTNINVISIYFKMALYQLESFRNWITNDTNSFQESIYQHISMGLNSSSSNLLSLIVNRFQFAYKVFLQIITGLWFLHTSEIYHRDLKVKHHCTLFICVGYSSLYCLLSSHKP